MADNSILFSTAITKLTKKEEEWLRTKLVPLDHQCNTIEEKEIWMRGMGFDSAVLEDFEDCWPNFEWRIFDDNDGSLYLWLFSEEGYPDLEQLGQFISQFLRIFRPEMLFYLEWADVCYKPRLDEFGGGVMVVSRNKIYTRATNELVTQLMEEAERDLQK